MAIVYQNKRPQAIAYNGAAVKKVTFNGRVVWTDLPAKAALSDMSWADIARVCRAGKAAEYWQLGDMKPFTYDGSPCQMQLTAFDHYDAADAAYGREKANIVLHCRQALESSPYADAKTSGLSWDAPSEGDRSRVRAQTLPSIWQKLPEALRSAAAQVLVPYYDNVSSGTLASVAEVLFIPSSAELFGPSAEYSDGAQYAFYLAGNDKRRYTPSGGAASVWTRTCNAESPSNANRVARICTAEGESSSTSPTNTRGVAPVICI